MKPLPPLKKIPSFPAARALYPGMTDTSAAGSPAGVFALSGLNPGLINHPAGFERQAEARRTKIWELAASLHCSIVGTCLTTGELRGLLRKFKQTSSETPTDHELHTIAVSAAG